MRHRRGAGIRVGPVRPGVLDRRHARRHQRVPGAPQALVPRQLTTMPGAVPLCRCGCVAPGHSTTHIVAAALAVDDLDRAIEAGLLDCPSCLDCTPACSASLEAARTARRNALAARERFRARQARLQRRTEAKAARRTA